MDIKLPFFKVRIGVKLTPHPLDKATLKKPSLIIRVYTFLFASF